MAKKGMKECPFCGVEVNKENFNKHLLKAHGDFDEEKFTEKGLTKPVESVNRKTIEKVQEIKETEKKRKKKKNSVAIAAIAIVVICILVGVYMYRNVINSNGSGTNSGGGNTSGSLPVAVMSTSKGVIYIQFDTTNAPITAANFIKLVNSGFYNGLIFHRIAPGFVIQSGGYTQGSTQSSSLKTSPYGNVKWENTGLKNLKYTISMARAASIDSASTQFFINLADNSQLDSGTPYVVFGHVTSGQSVVDAIAATPPPASDPTSHDYWPDNPPVINSVQMQ